MILALLYKAKKKPALALQHLTGKVEMWRGGCRLNISVSSVPPDGSSMSTRSRKRANARQSLQ